MKKKYVALFFIACACTMQANVVIPPGGAFWQQVVLPTPPNPIVTGEKLNGTLNNDGGGAAFWNNNTQDANDCRNIGCFVTKKSGFASQANSPNWSSPVYLGNSDGTAVENFYFGGNATGSKLLLEVAGWQSRNWMGWYAINPNAQNAPINFTAGGFGTSFGVFFDGNDTAGKTVASIPATNFGLWFLSNYSDLNLNAGGSAPTTAQLATALNSNAGRRFTQSSRNSSQANAPVESPVDLRNQYFAVFAKDAIAAKTTPVTYVIGMEDTNFANGSDRDYNDMIVSLTVVPEPGFYTVLSIGFVGLLVARRRKK